MAPICGRPPSAPWQIGVLDDELVLLLAQHETDARLVRGLPELRVDGRQVEVHLARVLGLKRARLELDDDEAPELQVEEQEVEVEVLVVDHEMHLTPDEREADAELQHEVAHVIEEPAFKIALLSIGAEGEEVEDVRILQRLLREIGVRWGQRHFEVRERLARTLVEAGLDLRDEHVA